MGSLDGEQRSSSAPKQLHEQFWPLVPKPPPSPGRDAEASDDVSGLFFLVRLRSFGAPYLMRTLSHGEQVSHKASSRNWTLFKAC